MTPEFDLHGATMTTAPPVLVRGWYYHEDSQGNHVHAIRMLVENDPLYRVFYRTLCGQVWFRSSTKTDLNMPSDWKCRRCLKALPRWEAK